MERQVKKQQSVKQKGSSDSRSEKDAPKGEMGKSATMAEKKDSGTSGKSTMKKDSDSSKTTKSKGSGSGNKKSSRSKK